MFIELLFLIFILSCKSKQNNSNDITEKQNTVLDKYMNFVKENEYYDTSRLEYQLLKSFYSKDSFYVQKASSAISYLENEIKRNKEIDKCITIPNLSEMGAEEAYCFRYSFSFSPYNRLATIIKFKDSILLKAVIYQYEWEKRPCKILSHVNIQVDSIKWENFQELIEQADFWGLKEDNNIHGVDGSTIDVYGFKKGNNDYWNPSRSAHVYRWNPGKVGSLMQCFCFLFDLSKLKEGDLF